MQSVASRFAARVQTAMRIGRTRSNRTTVDPVLRTLNQQAIEVSCPQRRWLPPRSPRAARVLTAFKDALWELARTRLPRDDADLSSRRPLEIDNLYTATFVPQQFGRRGGGFGPLGDDVLWLDQPAPRRLATVGSKRAADAPKLRR